MKLDSLKQKKYGLPVWAWALIIAGLIFLLYYLHKRNAGSSSTANNNPADPNATNPNDFGGSLETPWDYQSAPFDVSTDPTTSGSTPENTPTKATTTSTPTSPKDSPPTISTAASKSTASALAQVLAQPVGTAIPIVTQQQAAFATPGGVVGSQSKLVGAGGKNTL